MSTTHATSARSCFPLNAPRTPTSPPCWRPESGCRQGGVFQSLRMGLPPRARMPRASNSSTCARTRTHAHTHTRTHAHTHTRTHVHTCTRHHHRHLRPLNLPAISFLLPVCRDAARRRTTSTVHCHRNVVMTDTTSRWKCPRPVLARTTARTCHPWYPLLCEGSLVPFTVREILGALCCSRDPWCPELCTGA